MRGRAYGKINLSLEVTARRPDGYHDLVSVMQTVSLADDLEFEPGDSTLLECDSPELGGSDNLVVKAARLLGRGGTFRLRKRIPVAAGMGGGSSDGALALRLIDAAYGLGLPAADLAAAAAVLGSDVPFFLTGGTALVEGRGERVLPLVDVPPRWLVIHNPGFHLSTAAVFHELRLAELSDGAATHAWIARPDELPPAVNSLSAAALRLLPEIEAARDALITAGVPAVTLSGSGPTLFGICGSEAEARRVASTSGALVARFIPRHEALQLEQSGSS